MRWPVFRDHRTVIGALDTCERHDSEGRDNKDKPWNEADFVDKIVAVQRRRQEEFVAVGARVQVFDRSPICTLALAQYLGRPVTATLSDEIDRMIGQRIYDSRVFFVLPIGSVEPTAGRRITFQESLEFERVHDAAYRAHGFEVVDIPPGDVVARALIEEYATSWS
jgi:predicted ATPase